MVFRVAMEGIVFGMILGVFRLVVRGSTKDGLVRLVGAVLGRTKARFKVGATLFIPPRAPREDGANKHLRRMFLQRAHPSSKFSNLQLWCASWQ